MIIKRILTVMSLALVCSIGNSCGEPAGNGSAISGWEKMGEKTEEEEEENQGQNNQGQETTDPEDPYADCWFKTRGIVAGWGDVYAPYSSYKIDYLEIAKEHGLNTFSIYGPDRTSQLWKDYMAEGAKVGVKFEFQEHMMSFLLPRNLFSTHPEYFRMNKSGVRVEDANGCPSSEGALEQVYLNAKRLGESYKPTNHRYYFWLDDGGDICYCPKCKDYSASDQALIFENTIIKALKELDPDALLAHLAYNNTTNAPKNVKPADDIFLEFAPFHRDWSHPLSETWTEGNSGWTHAKYLKALQENLKVFPKETAQVLEYWMDDSLFSGWDQSNLKPVPWNSKVFLDDLKTYAKYGIRHITCYCAYVGPGYVQKFGFPDFLIEYADGLRDFRKE